MYIGETDDKRLARYLLMKRVNSLWNCSVTPSGWAVTLAGPTVGDKGSLQHILQINESDMIFVDKDSKASRPVIGSVTLKENIRSVIKNFSKNFQGGISFLNLDFCGSVSKEGLETAEFAKDLINDGGIISYTFFRGRENKGSFAYKLLAAAANKKGDYANRFEAVTGALQQVLGKQFVPVFALSYNSHKNRSTSPMGIVTFQKLSVGLRNNQWRKFVSTDVDKKWPDNTTVDSKIRVASLWLRDNFGLKSKQVGEVLQHNAGTIAAWMAIHSRGPNVRSQRNVSSRKK